MSRPEMPPLPPPEGAFAAVRRRALVRKLRVPAASVAGIALVAVALTAVPHGGGVSTLQPATTPTVPPSSDPASYSAVPSPVVNSATPDPTPSPGMYTAAPPTSAPDESPSPSPRASASYPPCRYQPGAWPTSGPDVTGTVVDRSGHPVPDVTITGQNCGYSGYEIARTDAQGRFRYACYGSWAVAAPFAWYSAKRSTSAGVGFAWLAGSMYANVPCGSDHHVVLPDAATVDFRLTDSAGNPVSGAGHDPLNLFEMPDETTPFAVLHWAADGTTSFTGLAPGKYMYYEPGHQYRYFTVTEGATVAVDVPWGGASASPSASPPPSPSITP